MDTFPSEFRDIENITRKKIAALPIEQLYALRVRLGNSARCEGERRFRVQLLAKKRICDSVIERRAPGYLYRRARTNDADVFLRHGDYSAAAYNYALAGLHQHARAVQMAMGVSNVIKLDDYFSADARRVLVGA